MLLAKRSTVKGQREAFVEYRARWGTSPKSSELDCISIINTYRISYLLIIRIVIISTSIHTRFSFAINFFRLKEGVFIAV